MSELSRKSAQRYFADLRYGSPPYRVWDEQEGRYIGPSFSMSQTCRSAANSLNDAGGHERGRDRR